MVHNPLSAVLEPGQADLIAAMMLTVPVCLLFKFCTNKHMFVLANVSLTLLVQFHIFSNEKYFLWAQQQAVYLLIRLVPRKYVGHAVTVESSLVLGVVHLRRIFISYGVNGFDITGILMMQFFNYVGLAYNYANGAKDPCELSDGQKARVVSNPPEYLTYLAYVMFLPACLVGPVYEYADFDDYLHRRKDYSAIPSTLRATANELLIFIGGVAAYFATSMFRLDFVVEAGFAGLGMLSKLGYVMAAITHIELKYVTAWSLGMAGVRASGLTYQKAGQGGDFSRVEMNGIRKFYLGPSMKVKVDNWNISVQWALRRYVYEQIYSPAMPMSDSNRKKRQSFAQFATLLASALWHGFYFGYFITFFHWVFCLQISQEIFRIRKTDGPVARLWNKHKLFFDVLENLLSTFALTFYGAAFHLMIWDRIKVYFLETNFIPYILLYVAFILVVKLQLLTPKRPKPPAAKPDAVSAKADAVSAKPDAVSAKPDAVSAKPDAVSAKPDAVSGKEE